MEEELKRISRILKTSVNITKRNNKEHVTLNRVDGPVIEDFLIKVGEPILSHPRNRNVEISGTERNSDNINSAPAFEADDIFLLLHVPSCHCEATTVTHTWSFSTVITR